MGHRSKPKSTSEDRREGKGEAVRPADDERELMKFADVLRAAAERLPHRLPLTERRTIQAALRDARPVALCRLEVLHVPPLVSLCEASLNSTSRGAPTDNLLACFRLCPECFQEARRCVEYLLGRARGEDPASFLSEGLLQEREALRRTRMEAAAKRRDAARERSRQLLSGLMSSQGLREEAPHLSPTDRRILAYLGRQSTRVLTGKIAADLSLNASSIGVNLSKLVKLRYIDSEKRVGYLITDKGRERLTTP